MANQKFKDIRLKNGAVDDVAINCTMFRLEQLDKDYWWAAAYIREGEDLKAVHFDIRVDRYGHIKVEARDDTIGCNYPDRQW